MKTSSFQFLRNCGQVVCDDCSQSRLKLPHLNLWTPVRVCSACVVRLANAPKPVSPYSATYAQYGGAANNSSASNAQALVPVAAATGSPKPSASSKQQSPSSSGLAKSQFMPTASTPTKNPSPSVSPLPSPRGGLNAFQTGVGSGSSSGSGNGTASSDSPRSQVTPAARASMASSVVDDWFHIKKNDNAAADLTYRARLPTDAQTSSSSSAAVASSSTLAVLAQPAAPVDADLSIVADVNQYTQALAQPSGKQLSTIGNNTSSSSASGLDGKRSLAAPRVSIRANPNGGYSTSDVVSPTLTASALEALQGKSAEGEGDSFLLHRSAATTAALNGVAPSSGDNAEEGASSGAAGASARLASLELPWWMYLARPFSAPGRALGFGDLRMRIIQVRL